MSLASDLSAALDPVRLAKRVGLTPDPWQTRVLRSSAPRLLLNCSRQSGKSTIAAVLAVWTAVYEPGALVLLLSPSLRQSSELFKKALNAYRMAGRPVAPEAETRLTLELENGSRVVSLPGTEQTVRGFSGVRLLLIDEASRVDDGLFYAIRPMVAVSGGRVIAMATPFGRRGFFHDAWTSTEPWERVQVTAHEVPRISAAFLAEERAAMPAWVYQQEYECVFGETVDHVFGYDLVMGALSADVAPLFGGTGDDDALFLRP